MTSERSRISPFWLFNIRPFSQVTTEINIAFINKDKDGSIIQLIYNPLRLLFLKISDIKCNIGLNKMYNAYKLFIIVLILMIICDSFGCALSYIIACNFASYYLNRYVKMLKNSCLSYADISKSREIIGFLPQLFTSFTCYIIAKKEYLNPSSIRSTARLQKIIYGLSLKAQLVYNSLKRLL